MSAFGQEPWARQALAALRRDWPDWAFLVVRYRWVAMRGKRVVIAASGPQELRHALPSLLPKLNSVEPGSASGSVASDPIERGMPGSGLVLPTLAELLEEAPGVSWAKAGASPLADPVLTLGAGGARRGDGVGAALSDPLTAVTPPPGVMAAERSVTGTWAVAGADGVVAVRVVAVGSTSGPLTADLARREGRSPGPQRVEG